MCEVGLGYRELDTISKATGQAIDLWAMDTEAARRLPEVRAVVALPTAIKQARKWLAMSTLQACDCNENAVFD